MEELQSIMEMEEVKFNFTGTGPQRGYAHDILNKALWNYLYMIEDTKLRLEKEDNEKKIKRMEKTIEANRANADKIYKLSEKKRISSKKVIEASSKKTTLVGGWNVFTVEFDKL